MAVTVEEEAASPVTEVYPQEARREAVTLEVHPAAAHQEVFLEEDLPAHYIGADAHENKA